MRTLLAYLIIHFLLVSGGSRAVAATLEDAAPLKSLLPGAQLKIKTSPGFDLRVFDAVSGQEAKCFILYAPQTLARLNQMGYRLNQISVSETVPGLTQQQCYDLPMR